MRSFTILSAFTFFVFTFLFSCTKIEYTTLGGDLVPDVDNVNTFDTTLDVTTENIQQNDDTTKLYYYDELVAGQIKTDPVFGPTSAAIFFELKPSTFSSTNTARNFIDSSLNAGSTTGYDSTVLSLKFDGGYGDSTQPIEFQVYALFDTLARLQDSIYPLNRTFRTETLLLGSKSVSLQSLTRDSILVSRSTTLSYKKTMELRIPVDLRGKDRWINLLKDSLALTDEMNYRDKFKGFAIKAIPSSPTGSLAYFTISDTATKLQFYYRRKNGGGTVIDTTNTNFYFNPNNSGYANNVDWTRGRNSELAPYLTPGADSFIYVKTNPGTQIRIRIQGLENVSNRIIHRAELKTYVIPTQSDDILTPPPVIYLERYDTAIANAYLPIPRDLNPNELYGTCFPSTNGINYGYFGGYPRNERMNNTNTKFYAFNISQYVQQIVTHQLLNSSLRLTANMNAQYINCNSGVPFRATSNIISYGRVKLGGGGLKGPLAPYKMRLRIIYSKI